MPNRPPGGDWIWRDLNGNGHFEDGEFTLNTSGKAKPGGWGWWVDTNGDIWRASDKRGIFRFRYGGLDKVGNPIYSYDKLTAYPMPEPFTELRRAIYDPAGDTLYVTGYTADAAPKPGINKEVGRVLVRYDKWSSGTPVKRYQVALPWAPDAKPILNLIGLTVEGRYLFGVEPVGNVHVYDKDTGRELGVIKPGRGSGARLGLGRRAVRDQRASPRQRRVPGLRGGGRARQGADVSLDAAMREAHEAMMAIEQVERNGRDLPGRRHG